MFGFRAKPGLEDSRSEFRDLGLAMAAIGALFGICYGIALCFHLGLRFGFFLACLVSGASSTWKSIQDLRRRRQPSDVKAI